MSDQNRITREELQDLIKDTVDSAVAPLRERQEDWSAKLFAAREAEAVKNVPAEEKGLKTARLIRALAAAKGDPERAAAWATKHFGDEALAKSLLANVGTAGGFTITPEYSNEFLDLLREQAVVRRMGATTLPMETGTMNISGLAGGTSVGYVGEVQNVPTTGVTFEQKTLTWKKMAALVPISNDLLRFSSPAADTIVRNDLVSSMALREDIAFIRDDGTAHRPRGLFHWALPANRFAADATTDLSTVTTDLGRAILRLKNAHVRFVRPGWLMTPRTEFYLLTVRDGNGNFAFRDEVLAGRLLGFPIGVTTQIPDNLGVGGNESEVYLVDFADAIIGESTQLLVDASTEAAYHDGTNVVAAFSLDQTVIRVIAQHDFAMRYPQSIAVITGVRWGV